MTNKENCSLLLLIVISFILIGCATPNTISPQGNNAEIKKEERKQKSLVLKRYIEEEDRVYNVAYPILIANAELCPKTYRSTGVIFWNSHSVEKKYRSIANIHFGLGEILQVRSVIKDSAADKVGIKIGDKLISINGNEIPPGKNAFKKLTKVGRKIEDQDIGVTLNREGEEIEVIVNRDLICGYDVVYDRNNLEINAFANGKEIFITRGMYRFTENDNELALVVAHELAHNSMGHISKKNKNKVAAGLIGLFAETLIAAAGGVPDGSLTEIAMNSGANAYSVEFEQEADYVGMYYLARAKYETNDVANFWRRMTSEYSDTGIDKDNTHPSSPKRFVAIEKAHEEIQSIKSAGGEIEPKIESM